MTTPAAPVPETPNFGFLARYDGLLVRVSALAERYFPDDPVTALVKLRQFGELLAQQVAARRGVDTLAGEAQADLLGRLQREAGISREVLDLFHLLRRVGNDAVHEHRGNHATALSALKVARQLAVWFHRGFGEQGFKPGPFQPPRPPEDPTAALREELEKLRAERDAGLSAVEREREARAAAEAARLTAEERTRAEAEQRTFWEGYAAETETAKLGLAQPEHGHRRMAYRQRAGRLRPVPGHHLRRGG